MEKVRQRHGQYARTAPSVAIIEMKVKFWLAIATLWDLSPRFPKQYAFLLGQSTSYGESWRVKVCS